MRIAIDLNEVLRDYVRQFQNMYRKNIDPNFDINYKYIEDFDLFNVFHFLDENGMNDRSAYNRFLYEDCAFEIFGRAEAMDKMLPAEFNLWTQNTMRNFEDDKIPEIILFSPFEINLSIQSTLAFLSRFGIRLREIHFPVDSVKMWDKCDIMITANPYLLDSTPEGKISFKVKAPYNKDAKSTYMFDSMLDIIHDDTIIKLIEKGND